MDELTSKHCEPCEAGTDPLTHEAIQPFLSAVPEWELIDDKSIHREFEFPDFKDALDFANRVGEIAEQEGHHPDLAVGWGHCNITLTTHAIGGLSENDFILAAKINELG